MKVFQCISVLLFFLFLFVSQQAYARDDYNIFGGYDEKSAVATFADEVEVFPQEEITILRGNARFIYKDSTLQADEITIDMREGTVTAVRNVVIWSGGETLTGERLVYDMRKKRASLLSSEWQTGSYQISGQETEAEYDDETVYVKNAMITSCDMIEPHYRLENERAKVALGKRLWTYNTLMYLGNLPVMYLPFFTRSLKDDWKGHIVGYTYESDRGFGLLNKYNLHFNPLWRVALYADWYPSYGYGLGVKESYHRKGDRPMDGKIYLYRLNLKSPDDDIDEEDKRYKIAGRHRQVLHDDLVFTANYQKLSDREFNDDLEEEEAFRGWDRNDLRSNRNSYANLAYTQPDYSLRLLVKENLNDFQLGEILEDERSPQIRWDKRRQLIPGLPIKVYRKAHIDYSRLRGTQEFSLQQDKVWLRRYDQVERIDFGLDLEAPFTVLRWLRVTPFAGYQGINYNDPETRWSLRKHQGGRFDITDPADVLFLQKYGTTYYSGGSIGSMWQRDSTWDDVFQNVGKVGVELSTRFVHPLGSTKRFSRMRLVTEPTITFVKYFTSDHLEKRPPNEFPATHSYRDTFLEIDETDSFRRSASILRGGAEFKLEGKDHNEQTHQLARLAVYAGHDYYDHTSNEHEDVITELIITPVEWAQFTHYWRYDPDSRNTLAMWDNLTLTPNEKVTVSVSYSHFRSIYTRTGTPSMVLAHSGSTSERFVDVRMDVVLSKKWTMELEHQYDLEESLVRENRIAFVRDLHDWNAVLSFRQTERRYRDKDFQITVGLQFKLPDRPTSVLPFMSAN